MAKVQKIAFQKIKPQIILPQFRNIPSKMSKQNPQLLQCKTRGYSGFPYCETTFHNVRKKTLLKTSLRLTHCNPPSTTSSPVDKWTTEASSRLCLLDISSFRTVFMAQSIAITEILRALCILKKGWEDIEVELNAHSEDLLLLVNNRMKVMLVFLPGLQCPKDQSYLQQDQSKPLGRTLTKRLETSRMLHTHD